MQNVIRWALLFAIGALLGTALDHLHVSFGVLDYPGAHPFAQRLWVPPLFGGATVLFVAAYRSFRSAGERGTPLSAGLTVLLFSLAYFASAAFHQHPRALLAGMLLGFLPFAWGPNHLRRGAYCVLIAIGGALFETALIKLQAFRYLAPGPFPVPIWLPALYLYAALAARQLDLAFFHPAPLA